jgi:enolase
VGKRLALRDQGFAGGKGDEGAWAPKLKDDEALEVASSAIRDVSTAVGFGIRMGLDIASSSFWDEEAQVYDYRRSGTRRTPGDQVDYVVRLVKDYRLIYVEDPLHEDAFDEFGELTRKVRDTYIVGDDLLVTNPARLEKAASIGAGNAAILKVNQAGGLGDALRFSETARRKGYALITSHRSGDTPEAHIAHIGIATESIMLKAGVVGGERVAKLNELIRISELGDASEMVRLRF